ncbi:hypothetical protein BDB01DRAFT_831744 [Pilobolus umbonatus]|nr:hypothetical protein BDB01DRAFT_831744 [Pilobolus umbonatus]
MSDSEDEYGPLATAWGSQLEKKADSTPSSELSEDVEGKPSWNSLLDPTIKLGDNGIGSGNLHRRGKNFKPVDEKVILDQRLKVNSKKSKVKDADEPRHSYKSTQPHKSLDKRKKTFTEGHHNVRSTTTSTKQPVMSTLRAPPAPSSDNMWSKQTLATTPFWMDKNTVNGVSLNTSQNGTPSTVNTKGSVPPENNWNSFSRQSTLTSTTNTNTQRTNHPKVDTAGNNGRQSWNNDGQSWNNVIQPVQNDIQSWNNVIQPVRNDIQSWDSIGKSASSDTAMKEKQAIPTPPWLNKIPDVQQSDNKNNSNNVHRFANRTMKKYSDIPIEVPKPVNYFPEQPIPVPKKTAQPPPPENSLLVKIYIQLSPTKKKLVNIHELDEPINIANKFASENGIDNPMTINAIAELCRSQKEKQIKLNNQKLKKKSYAQHGQQGVNERTRYSQPREYSEPNHRYSNEHTDPTNRYSQPRDYTEPLKKFSQSKEYTEPYNRYSQPKEYIEPHTPAPFTRNVYY